ncbi:hypothetical protein EXU85_24160 [Spirosoma sp. KCTC 42546]|uniref:hypothetical protein n=1 Tax=Spirosoma sp. KCTC 42546 TaxID=2520506 RepID=UPI001156D974|nr:hypothetical protein [Spirosoma sp. KCTC 42546]QDK81532.1 hypothetical protein EXU85_24160 [Spirosoma sp. KCTC 42546]
MQQMRYAKWLVLIVSLTGCDILSAGTLGAFQQWNFSATEKRLDKEMAVLYKNNPEYVIPEKWKYLDSWQESGYGSLNGKIIYFSNRPEEMYYISYFEIEANSPGNDSDSTITTIAVRAVNNGNSSWDTAEEFEKNKAEEKKINSRFYNEIISKLEIQIGQTAKKEKA